MTKTNLSILGQGLSTDTNKIIANSNALAKNPLKIASEV